MPLPFPFPIPTTRMLRGLIHKRNARCIHVDHTVRCAQHVDYRYRPSMPRKEDFVTADEPQMQVLTDLANMVSIQTEATVSRTVMHTEGGNVVLFSFDAGQQLSEHTAAMPVFVQVLRGRLLIKGGDDEREIVPGDLVYFPTRLPHAVTALEPSIMMLTMNTAARATNAIDAR